LSYSLVARNSSFKINKWRIQFELRSIHTATFIPTKLCYGDIQSLLQHDPVRTMDFFFPVASHSNLFLRKNRKLITCFNVRQKINWEVVKYQRYILKVLQEWNVLLLSLRRLERSRIQKMKEIQYQKTSEPTEKILTNILSTQLEAWKHQVHFIKLLSLIKRKLLKTCYIHKTNRDFKFVPKWFLRQKPWYQMELLRR